MVIPSTPFRCAASSLCECRITLIGSKKRYSSTGRKIFRENDIVFLKQKRGINNPPILSKPLRVGSFIATERDRNPIAADNIIGKAVRETVRNAKGVEYRIREPSLGEYTDLSPRLVTPIYSQDANLIVALLDLHPSNPGADSHGGHDKLEIFEAGTGHGALTLNLARAIHGANTAAPPIPHVKIDDPSIDAELEVESGREIYDNWRAKRRAIIHTLDQSIPYSKHARRVVKNFRHGMYYPNVDFHTGSIEGFLMERSETAFLDHAILDVPNTHHYFKILGKALKANGSLLTWCPSITQIIKCISLVRKDNLPFILERVIEVGGSLNGGREWDIRMVKPRTSLKVNPEFTGPGSNAQVLPSAEKMAGPEGSAALNEGLELVCRPKVGIRIVGGGFIALWRRMEHNLASDVKAEPLAETTMSIDGG